MKKEMIADKLRVYCYETRQEMGQAAASALHSKMLELLESEEHINMLFAAAPSQNEMLSCLSSYNDIPWERINALHMDEYVGLPADAPQGFGNFLRRLYSIRNLSGRYLFSTGMQIVLTASAAGMLNCWRSIPWT